MRCHHSVGTGLAWLKMEVAQPTRLCFWCDERRVGGQQKRSLAFGMMPVMLDGICGTSFHAQ